MKYKHIEASREARLWITQVVIPIFGVVMMVPETREAALAKIEELKKTIKNKLGNI